MENEKKYTLLDIKDNVVLDARFKNNYSFIGGAGGTTNVNYDTRINQIIIGLSIKL